tara:strand:- start:105 stop:221 length:117 start_codon:yes stop_codon:yes gene_type:complete
MIQKFINFIAQLFGVRKKLDKDKDKENKKNPDDIYPLW